MSQNRNRSALPKAMFHLDTFALAFGAMIGWGWVILTSRWISAGGILGAALAFVGGGIMCSVVSLVYAELTSAMPVAGGPMAFTYRAFGERWAWFTGWVMAFAYVSVVAWESVAIVTAVNYIIPVPKLLRIWTIAGEDVYLGWALLGTLIGAIIAYLNCGGIRSTALAQNWGTALLLASGAVFVVAAFVGGSAANFSPLWTSAKGVAAVLMMVPFLMVGFDIIPESAEEINLPYHVVGRLLMVSVSAATLWYVAIILGLGYAIPADVRQASPMAVAAAMECLFGSRIAGKAIAVGGICGILTTWNGFFVGASRVLFAMGRAKMLPAAFSKVHPSTGSPTYAVAFVGLICAFAPFLGSNALTWLADVGGLCTSVMYLMVSASFVQLRRREPFLERPFRAGSGSLIGILALITTAAFVSLYLPVGPSSLKWPHEWMIVILWGAVGLVCFVIARKAEGNTSPAERFFLIFGTNTVHEDSGQQPNSNSTWGAR